jgi:hypothetical protein
LKKLELSWDFVWLIAEETNPESESHMWLFVCHFVAKMKEEVYGMDWGCNLKMMELDSDIYASHERG